MNFSEVVQNLDAILTEKKNQIGDFSQFSGGWEGWLQVEMTSKWGYGKVLREQPVWGDKRAIDLWFPDTNYGVELKCLGLNRTSYTNHIISDINSTYKKFAQEVLEDVKKLEEFRGSGLGIVVIPTWLPEEAISKIKNELSSKTFSWRYMGNAGFVVGLHCNYFL